MCHFYLTRRASVNHAPELFRAGGIFQPPPKKWGSCWEKSEKRTWRCHRQPSTEANCCQYVCNANKLYLIKGTRVTQRPFPSAFPFPFSSGEHLRLGDRVLYLRLRPNISGMPAAALHWWRGTRNAFDVSLCICRFDSFRRRVWVWVCVRVCVTSVSCSPRGCHCDSLPADWLGCVSSLALSSAFWVVCQYVDHYSINILTHISFPLGKRLPFCHSALLSLLKPPLPIIQAKC